MAIRWLPRIATVATLGGAMAFLFLAGLRASTPTVDAQEPPAARAEPQMPGGPDGDNEKSQGSSVLPDPTPEIAIQLQQLRHAAIRLPIAVLLACVLAVRPRRRGTPARQLPVIQTQIILAIVGALVMLVVGSSLARAFGIVGAAGLVRYRAKIADPKDAGVMLSTLAVGLASGVGLWMLAAFSTGFILIVLGIVESFEPKARQTFSLKVKANDPVALKPKLEELLAQHHIRHELRMESKDEIDFEVQLPMNRKTDALSDAILTADNENVTGVEWEEKKVKS